jgi:hypothetical protein
MPTLVSPGVSVSVIDQSQYLAAPTNSVPLIVVATATNKANAAGTGVALATTKANANKLYQITSQRDLVTLFGNPFFYKTQNGTPIQGYELNEYGLLTAYSVLGVTNRCYVLRADVDLASLVGSVTRPSGSPAAGAYWLDTTATTWGIYEFNAVTSKFVAKTPIVITDSSKMDLGLPKASVGSIGDYAVNAMQPANTPESESGVFYKNLNNDWVKVGSTEWLSSIATVTGTASSPTLVAADTFTIDAGATTATIAVPAAPNNTVQGVAGAIAAAAIPGVSAEVVSNRLRIYSAQPGEGKTITLANVIGAPLTAIGITAGTYYQPEMSFGSSAAMPLWSAGQTKPHPTGSVWMKVGASGVGSSYSMMRYSNTVGAYQQQSVAQYASDAEATFKLDATGGAAIPADTLYAQYSFAGAVKTAPTYFWKRYTTGQTIVSGTRTDFSGTTTFVNGDEIKVRVSVPGSSVISDEYLVTLSGMASGTSNTDTAANAIAFVASWQAANIPETAAEINAGAIQITHKKGGEIYLVDSEEGALEYAGFVANSTAGVKFGPYQVNEFAGIAAATTVSTAGAAATFNVKTEGTGYTISSIAAAGTGYVVGDTLIISGADLGGEDETNDLFLTVSAVATGGAISAVIVDSGVAESSLTIAFSNWVKVDYTANEGAPKVKPANGTNWFYSNVSEADILINVNSVWKGYRNVAFDTNGKPTATGTNATDVNGPMFAASAPETQSDGSTALAYGDLWIDTSDLDNYPLINRWQSVDGVNQWVRIDNTDQVSDDGIVFADARWGKAGDIDVINDPLPTVKSLLTSDYLDLDAPAASLYPQGTLLFNTRRSGYTVKQFRKNYFNGKTFEGTLPEQTDTWVTVSGNAADGSANMGRKAQRALIVAALKAAVSTNQDIREEDLKCNLMAAPGYPELQPELVALNNERNNTAYIVGDTPLRLTNQATDLVNWAQNKAGATQTSDAGLVTLDEYMGVFYPSGLATDLSGASVVVPASHMMLRTFLRNDQVAYPWFAAAGTRRGTIDNATSIGYLDAKTGEFQTSKTGQGLRDVLYANNINPLAYFTGVGLVNYGNKNVKDTQSAMNRTNVSRLVAYIRERLQVATRPFIFEPNDRLTRQQVVGVIQSLFIDINAKRGLNDWLVVCDESNNTPDRIDRNELWIDIAIEPIKALEFVYIPVRIMNTGAIAKL